MAESVATGLGRARALIALFSIGAAALREAMRPSLRRRRRLRAGVSGEAAR